jgi:hypothetical protein
VAQFRASLANERSVKGTVTTESLTYHREHTMIQSLALAFGGNVFNCLLHMLRVCRYILYFDWKILGTPGSGKDQMSIKLY